MSWKWTLSTGTARPSRRLRRGKPVAADRGSNKTGKPSNEGNPVGKKTKVLTKREARDKGELGAFALHLAALLQERGWDHAALSKACKRAGLPIEEHAVRAWLRAENMPKAQHLRGIGKVLGLADPRHILPG